MIGSVEAPSVGILTKKSTWAPHLCWWLGGVGGGVRGGPRRGIEGVRLDYLRCSIGVSCRILS